LRSLRGQERRGRGAPRQYERVDEPNCSSEAHGELSPLAESLPLSKGAATCANKANATASSAKPSISKALIRRGKPKNLSSIGLAPYTGARSQEPRSPQAR
jgi:hypothetical protein